MKVKIGEPTVKCRNQYVAEVMFMHGDADGDTLWTLELQSLDDAFAIYKFDAAWSVLSSRERWKFIDRGDDKRLANLPGFDFLFGDIGGWPKDETTDGLLDPNRLAAYRWYKLFWYDEVGLKYNVEIVED